MREMNSLEAWKGEFGDYYTDRNQYADWKIQNGVQVFQRLIGGLELKSVLEVGSNLGLNLLAIDQLFNHVLNLYAVEPNQKAFERLSEYLGDRLTDAWNCDGYSMPLADSSIDLVFTSGVLVLIPSADLPRAIGEMVRVSRRYVMCLEYFSHDPVEVPYRGMTGMLFKRDFGGFFLDHHPKLKPVGYGFLWQREFANFDNLNWWLFEKPAS